jgi:hypothetical protein
MSLDLSKLIGQIVDLAAHLKSKEAGREAKLEFAMKTLKSSAADLDALKQKVEASKTTWLVAGPNESADLRQTALLCPENFIVLGSDGSHIDVDRHQSAHCFLINIGTAKLRYGRNPDAQLLNFPSLYFRDVDVTITSDDGRQVPVEGQLLGIKRSIEECRILVEKASELEADLPVIMLLDGSLIFWRLAEQVYQDFIIRELLIDGFLKYLGQLKDISRGRQLAVASYISFPRSTDVVNLLRLAVCPHTVVDCDRYCSGKFSARKCDSLSGLLDRDLFNRLLAPGERSAVFSSRSSVVTKYYGANEVNFFYIRLDREVARIEVPLWVAEDEKLLGLVHCSVLNQCRLGLGYPVALSEAHEQAVINTADREQFWRLVEQVMIEDGIFPISSAKSESKRARWL